MPGSNKPSTHGRKLRDDSGHGLTRVYSSPLPLSLTSNQTEAREDERFAASVQIESMSKLVLDTVGEGIYCVDAHGIAIFVNPATARMAGWKPEELLGREIHSILHHSYPDGTPYPVEDCPIVSVPRNGQVQHREDEVFWRRDGTSFAVSYTSRPIFSGGAIEGAVVVFRDISERVRGDRWQRAKAEVFKGITTRRPIEETLQYLADGYTAYNPGCAIAILLREKDGPALLHIASSMLPSGLRPLLDRVQVEKNVSACGHAAFTGQEVLTKRRGGTGPSPIGFIETRAPHPARCLAFPMIAASGTVLGVVAFFAEYDSHRPRPSPIFDTILDSVPDLTLPVIDPDRLRGVRDLTQIAVEHRGLREELQHQSEHDSLTGLANGLLLGDRLARALKAADRAQTRVAFCTVDVDRLRKVNENFGHETGDALLRQLAVRFTSALRDIDTLAREGGDEFIVLLPEIHDASDAETICRRLLNAVAEPFVVKEKSIKVAINIGMSLYPDHAATAELLMRHAGTALVFAKVRDHPNFKIYRPDLGEKVRQLAARESALRTALEREEFFLMYQPLYTSDRAIHGFEALLRWQHPELGLIPPDQFIPLAEETGLILPIGEWVLREACRQAMSWRPKKLGSTKIFVNISALQLGQADFTKSVSYALRLSGLPPSRLELEVTESFIVPSFKKATARLQPLQDLGVSVAIDDFGTGHSSFSVLHKLPINAIKVDRSFVSRIDKDISGLSTVRAIVSLAQQLGMKTVAEGVETEAQFKLLNEMQCDYFQGYLLSKPLTVDAAQVLFGDALRLVPAGTRELSRSA